jgi:hypothetical protein
MSTPDISPVIGHSIRFSLSRWDVLRCRLWVIFHHKVLLGLMVLLSLGAALLTMPAPGHVTFSALFKLFYVVVTTGMMFCVMAVFQLGMQVLWLFANKNRGVIGNHELQIRDDGLLEKTSVNESLHRWSGFHRIASSGSYLYIFVTDNNVQYVPVRCFGSDQDARAFREEIRKRAGAA